MKDMETKLFNAIVTILDTSFTNYDGLDDEEFIAMICESVGLTLTEYRELMGV